MRKKRLDGDLPLVGIDALKHAAKARPRRQDTGHGVVVGQHQRQLRAGELENRQKLWRWVVIAVIALLLLETLLASRAARSQLAST